MGKHVQLCHRPGKAGGEVHGASLLHHDNEMGTFMVQVENLISTLLL